MQLITMHDIGGCRAVLGDVGEVRRVQKRLEGRRPVLKVRDYVEQPRPSGYRSVHVIVTYPDRAGENRPIEVQLRTPAMHEWAVAVERYSGRIGHDLKSGEGPGPVLEWLRAASDVMAADEAGQEVSAMTLERLARLKAAALPYFQEVST